MRATAHHLRAGMRHGVVTFLLLTVALGVAACSGGDGANILGTPQQAEFETACNEALAQVRVENGWESAEIVAIEREREDGIDVYGVQLDNGVEIEFASDEGCRVLEIEHQDDDDEGEDDDDAGGDD